MTGWRVVVAEDNERNMKLFREVLRSSGYRTLEAETGERAVALTTEHRPDLVLMDIHLPDIDGVEALRMLRADERTASVPVLAVTAQAMEGDRERFLGAGFDGYLSKPVNIPDLLAAVRPHCEGGSRAGAGRPRGLSPHKVLSGLVGGGGLFGRQLVGGRDIDGVDIRAEQAFERRDGERNAVFPGIGGGALRAGAHHR